MSKHILVLSTSLRKGGNSEALAAAFARGAQEAGSSVELVSLCGKTVGFCTGCLACQTASQCVLRDDAADIVHKMQTADAIVFSTPVYFYEMCGQMKTLLDRTNPLFPANYAFRTVYLLASAAQNEQSAMDGTLKGLRNWVDCFEKAQLVGTIFAGGVTDTGDIQGHLALQQAYHMGKSA